MLYWVDQMVYLFFSIASYKKKPEWFIWPTQYEQYQAQYLKQLSLKYQFESGS